MLYLILLYVIGIPVFCCGLYWITTGGFDEIKDCFNKKPKYDYSTQIKFLDDSLWVKKVIESCNNRKQIWVANDLITCFKNKYYEKVEQSLYRQVCNSLNDCWDKIENKCFLQETRALNERKIRKRS